MKILYWRISKDRQRIAKLHWFLYKIFGIKRTTPCGFSKNEKMGYCALDGNCENSVIINDGNIHEVRCKVCGHLHMSSSDYIEEDWFESSLYWI